MDQARYLEDTHGVNFFSPFTPSKKSNYKGTFTKNFRPRSAQNRKVVGYQNTNNAHESVYQA